MGLWSRQATGAFEEPIKVSLQVSPRSLNISPRTLKVSARPFKISTRTLKVSALPLKISTRTLKVPVSLQVEVKRLADPIKISLTSSFTVQLEEKKQRKTPLSVKRRSVQGSGS